jgi:hypothetical protein
MGKMLKIKKGRKKRVRNKAILRNKQKFNLLWWVERGECGGLLRFLKTRHGLISKLKKPVEGFPLP